MQIMAMTEVIMTFLQRLKRGKTTVIILFYEKT